MINYWTCESILKNIEICGTQSCLSINLDVAIHMIASILDVAIKEPNSKVPILVNWCLWPYSKYFFTRKTSRDFNRSITD